MKDKEELKLVYTGTVVEANFLQSLLEENGIGALVRDTLHESVVAGWASGPPMMPGWCLLPKATKMKPKN